MRWDTKGRESRPMMTTTRVYTIGRGYFCFLLAGTLESVMIAGDI